MITRDEIDTVAQEQEVSAADVERDYIFGWLLAGLFNDSAIASSITLKGGNALRKGYFPGTRFSADLDFSTPGALDPEAFLRELNQVCRLVQASTKVVFETEQNRIVGQQQIQGDKVEHKYNINTSQINIHDNARQAA